jgi:hypothetical protein
MPIRVSKVLSCVDGTFVQDPRFKGLLGEIVGPLTSMKVHPLGNGPEWAVDVTIKDERGLKRFIPMALDRFLSAEEYQRSFTSPLCLAQLDMAPPIPEPRRSDDPRSVWIYRDGIYVTERVPSESELEEVTLRIKSLHFQDDEDLKRLREEVSNFEAIEHNLETDPVRRSIPDDVKLLVWARDGGACVKCGAKGELQFDHIIPLSRGGGDHAENIQLLCRSCNLAKGPRLV